MLASIREEFSRWADRAGLPSSSAPGPSPTTSGRTRDCRQRTTKLSRCGRACSHRKRPKRAKSSRCCSVVATSAACWASPWKRGGGRAHLVGLAVMRMPLVPTGAATGAADDERRAARRSTGASRAPRRLPGFALPAACRERVHGGISRLARFCATPHSSVGLPCVAMAGLIEETGHGPTASHSNEWLSMW